MFKFCRPWCFWRAVGGALLLAVATAAQTPVLSPVQTVPTGQRPMGIGFGDGDFATRRVVVANSGENSVTILLLPVPNLTKDLSVLSSKVVSGIPAPFGVTEHCSPTLVTSPSNGSVSVVDTVNGVVKATIKVGALPYSAECSGTFISNPSAFISNYGDNSVSVLDLSSLTVSKTVPNVPGSRNQRGLAVDDNGRVWIAGTDANVVTIVNPMTSTVVATIPIRSPSFVIYSSGLVWVGSLMDNSIYGLTTTGLNITTTISNIPTPQDFVPTGVGQFAATGPGNSVAWIVPPGLVQSSAPGATTFIPGIPGAAGIIGYQGCVPRGPCGFALVTSPGTNQVFLISVGPPPAVPNDFRVANGASFGTGQVSPGTLASLFATTGASQNFIATSLPLPQTLGGLTVSLGGSLSLDATQNKWVYSPAGSMRAALLFVGPTQINFQIPPGITPGSAVPAQLTKPDGTTLLTAVNIAATSPGIFTLLQNGQGQAAILNQDNSRNFGTNPAQRGSFIQIYGTGAGATNPSLGAGEPAPAGGNPLVFTQAQPTVTIGGKTARVLFSGLTPSLVGLWQINAEIPADVTPGLAVPLSITAGGVTSNTVTIAVQ